MTQESLPQRSKDFSAWYNQVVQKAELADYGPARGTMVIRPYGYALWENIVSAMDREIKAAGVENAYFPLFIPMHLLQTEQEHVEGFSPHLAVVTHGGGKELEEPLVVRPTSETIMYPYYKKWVHSWRDLPILINQWNNVVRWEQRTVLFLRTMEFLWQEGHTAHATHEESWTEVRRALTMYEKVYRDALAMAGYSGIKSSSEKFAGADATTTFELLMPDGKALQGCTSHDLGQNFSRPFDISFINKDGKRDYAWQTSWGFTTRSIGALIMSHGDDKGLKLPPEIAPVQVVIVPISGKNNVNIQSLAYSVRDELRKVGVRAKIDDRDTVTPGFKFNEWEMRGVPVRLEIGQKELQDTKLAAHRRDRGRVTIDKHHLQEDITVLLRDIQRNMFQQSEKHLHDNTHDVSTYDEFKRIMETQRGFIRAFWCEDPSCEQSIKEQTKATTRCLPFDAKNEQGSCVYCKKAASHRWIFAQSY